LRRGCSVGGGALGIPRSTMALFCTTRANSAEL